MDEAARIDELLTGFASGGGFDGVVHIDRDGSLVYERAFGLASRTWNVPNTLETRFDTASITKLFTAVGVLQQVDAGAIALDTTVLDLLGITDTTISRDVTVLQLLSHTSGIGDDADEEAGEDYADLWIDRPNYSIRTTEDMLPQFLHKPAVFAPGEGCRYNNVGYVLLGLCIERLTGIGYRDYVREHVFAPAGMNRSGFFRMDVVEPDVAEGTDPIRDEAGEIVGWQRNIYSYPPIGSPDGGAHVTASDLIAFLRATLDARLCSADSVRELLTMRAFHSMRRGRAVHWSLGLEFELDAEGRVLCFHKDGMNAGASANLRHYPRSGTTLAILSNSMDGAWPPLRALDELLVEA